MAETRLSKLRTFILFSFIGVLAACGGGGGSGDPGFIGGGIGDAPGGGTDSPLTLTLELTDADGMPTTTITSSSPAILTVKVSQKNSAATSQIVTIVADLVAVSPGSGSALTNDEGIAVFTLSAAGNSGAGTATVTVEEVTASVVYEVDAVLDMTLRDEAGNDITNLTDGVTGIVTVTVTDSDGTPQQGAVVEAATSRGSIDPGSALTAANGEAKFFLVPGDTSGAGTVTATVGTDTVSLNFQILSSASGSSNLSLRLTDPDGNPTTNVTSVKAATLTVTATDTLSQPLANVIISAASDIGAISPESGTALTDINGVATFRLEAGGVLGAGTLTATLGDASESVNFQVGEADLRIGRLDGSDFIEGEIQAGATSLPAAGSTPLSVLVVDSNGDPVQTTVPVNFSTGCANLTPPEAEITGTVNTVNGVATSTYTATGCTGQDVVTAEIVQGNATTATVTLDIATADANSISFISATPESIALKGSGGEGRQESSTLVFQVLDTTGSPASGVDVGFSLSTTAGGLSLTNPTATTNDLGQVNAIVQAGNISTSVRVTATITVNGVQRSTVSDKLIISTGLPDQNSVSLAVETGASGGFNNEGGDIDGASVTLTLRMADKFNNPVPDGTVAFFTTEYGSVVDSCVTTGGTCTSEWTAQAPRQPLIYNNSGGDDYVATVDSRVCPATGLTGFPCPGAAPTLGYIIGHRSSVSVIAIGEESFIDTNGDGLWSVGEQFQDLPEAWLDKNEDGVYRNVVSTCTASDLNDTNRRCAEGREESYFDFDNDGVYDVANGLYNGSLCPENLADAGSCSRELVHVRQEVTLTLSQTINQRIIVLDGANVRQTSFQVGPATPVASFTIYVADTFNNPPAAGATITVESDSCEITSTTERTMPNTAANGPFGMSLNIVNVTTNTTENTVGSLIVTATSPSGAEVFAEFPCTDLAN